MSGFYDDMAATALELLAEFGQSVTLSRTTGGSIDPVTGAVTAGTDASVITTGLIKPYPDKMIDGTRILASDRELVLSNEQVPLSTDKPVIGGEEFAIVDIKTVSPAGTDVVYFCQARK
jgi:hypothetical protein